MAPIIWQPNRAVVAPPWPVPPLGTAIARGMKGLCPACGERNLFYRYLKVVPVCHGCGAPLGSARSDDAPPYIVIVIVGHIVVPLVLVMQQVRHPPDWVSWMIFLPLTVALCLLLLQPVKGAVVGVLVNARLLKKPDPLE